jgi:hypothetical protein
MRQGAAPTVASPATESRQVNLLESLHMLLKTNLKGAEPLLFPLVHWWKHCIAPPVGRRAADSARVISSQTAFVCRCSSICLPVFIACDFTG